MAQIRDCTIFFFVVILAVVLTLIFVDWRPSPPIESDMIKEFDKTVKPYVDDDVTKVWTLAKPFPLKSLVSNHNITIDKAFQVNNLTLNFENVQVPIGPKLI
jgi:flagellar biosynthesis protein FliQ